MPGDTAASEGNNGKVTLAVIATKLDVLIASVEKLTKSAAADHDTITTLATQMEDLQYIKKVVAGVVVGLVLSLAMALYAVSQQVAAAMP